MSVLPKINEEILAEANLMDKVANDVLDPPEEEEETIVNSNEPEVLEEIPEPEEKSQDELFEKPEASAPPPAVEISKKTGKPKRKLTQKQLDSLAKAREKSMARRAKSKEAKLEKKKAMKAKPQVSIPTQNYMPQKPIDPMYYNGNMAPQGQYTTQPQYRPVPRIRKKDVTPLNTLFGNFTQNN